MRDIIEELDKQFLKRAREIRKQGSNHNVGVANPAFDLSGPERAISFIEDLLIAGANVRVHMRDGACNCCRYIGTERVRK